MKGKGQYLSAATYQPQLTNKQINHLVRIMWKRILVFELRVEIYIILHVFLEVWRESASLKCRACQKDMLRKNYKQHLKTKHPKENHDVEIMELERMQLVLSPRDLELCCMMGLEKLQTKISMTS